MEMNTYGSNEKYKDQGRKVGKRNKMHGSTSSSIGGHNNDITPGFNSDSSNEGLVDSLISSWMQNTNMAQMMRGMEQQLENAALPQSLPTSQDEPPKKKKNRLVQFFKRRFGRNDHNNSHNALATMSNGYNYAALARQNQPQMVVHQHVHHVVHHVVHEYKD